MKTCKRGLHEYEGRRCPECLNIWQKANRERGRAAEAKYRTSHPEQVKARLDRYQAAHPHCIKEWSAKYRAAHPDKMKGRYAKNPQAYQDYQHRRRARKAGNTGNESVTKAHLILLLDAQDGCCRYCRAPLNAKKHLDHRIPLARGGPHAPSNVCWACPTCNRRKGKMTESEFIDRGE